jgi:hypothetical protein
LRFWDWRKAIVDFGLLIEKSEGRGDGWQGVGGADENIFYQCNTIDHYFT